MTDPTTTHKRPIWQIAVVVILALFAISLLVPGVRASLSAWLGLSVADSDQVPASPVTLVAVTSTPPASQTGGATGAPSSTQAGSKSEPTASLIDISDLNQLASQAGWEILTPGWLPDGYKFQSAYFDPNQKMVFLTYLVTRALPGSNDPSLTTSKTITLLQALKNDFVPMQVAPKTNVEDAEVNGIPAAYAMGAWDTEFVQDETDPSGGKLISTWRNDLQVQNIFWQDGKVYLVLLTDDEALSRRDLLEMASSINR